MSWMDGPGGCCVPTDNLQVVLRYATLRHPRSIPRDQGDLIAPGNADLPLSRRARWIIVVCWASRRMENYWTIFHERKSRHVPTQPKQQSGRMAWVYLKPIRVLWPSDTTAGNPQVAICVGLCGH